MNNLYRPAWAEINLSTVKYNCEIIKNFLAPNVQICADGAANAYGHGALEISLACIQAGVKYLSVTSTISTFQGSIFPCFAILTRISIPSTSAFEASCCDD